MNVSAATMFLAFVSFVYAATTNRPPLNIDLIGEGEVYSIRATSNRNNKLKITNKQGGVIGKIVVQYDKHDTLGPMQLDILTEKGLRHYSSYADVNIVNYPADMNQ